MAKGLNYQTICNMYTLVQIQEKVDFYIGQVDRATTKLYDKDTTQGRQRVESADIDKISEILAVWLKALECKSGLGQTHIISGNFLSRGF